MHKQVHTEAMQIQPLCNEAQKAAITHELGPVLCLAGPGSGKTFTLTHHIRYLVSEKHVDPYQILVITFSKAAALEMQHRFTKLMENRFYPVRFGTFHAIFFQILTRYSGYSSKDILTIPQKKKYLKTVLAQMHFQGKEDTDTLEKILQQIAYVKNNGGISGCVTEQNTTNIPLYTNEKKQPEHKKQEQKMSGFDIPQFEEIYDRYENIIRQEHVLDFEDMMLLCYDLFIKNPNVLEEYRKDIQYVLIDEYQDINPIQYEIIKLLVEPHQNLFAVGDDDQSIYGFRGSNPEIMLRFQKDFPDGIIIPFQKNYRSVNSIVEHASGLIRFNTKRYEKNISATRSGNGVFFNTYASKEDEYAELLDKLRQAKQKGSLGNCACLFRTNTDASYLAELLLKEKIPYNMREIPYNPYEHFICKDFLHYLRLKEGNRSVQEFVPVMNRPLRYLSREALFGNEVDFGRLMIFYKDKPYMINNIQKLEYDLERMKKMDLYAAVNYIRKGIGYDEYLRKLAVESGQSSESYLKTADELQKRFALFDSMEVLQYHIETYAGRQRGQEMQNNPDAVNIMTYHASKGLEFDTVYLPDCNEGIIPHKKSSTTSHIEEERRLFYVAMTRAKEYLHIMYVEGNDKEKHLVSRFVKDICNKKEQGN